MSHVPNGDHRFKNPCAVKISEFTETIFFWMIKRFVLTIVRPSVSILLPHKRDVFKKTYVLYTYHFLPRPLPTPPTSLLITCFNYRFDHEQYRKEGIIVLTWTVNEEEEQLHVTDVLRMPYMTDHAPNS